MTHNPNVYGYVNGKPVFSRVEEIYEDKDGNTKHVTVVGPHGDAC